MADRLIEHATNDRLSGAMRRSEFMNSLTSIELFFKGRLSRMRACARKLKNRSPPRYAAIFQALLSPLSSSPLLASLSFTLSYDGPFCGNHANQVSIRRTCPRPGITITPVSTNIFMYRAKCARHDNR